MYRTNKGRGNPVALFVFVLVSEFWKYLWVIFPQMVKGEESNNCKISNGTPPPTTEITHFEIHKKTNQTELLKCFCGAPIQNGGLKREWVWTQNKGQPMGFELWIYKL